MGEDMQPWEIAEIRQMEAEYRTAQSKDKTSEPKRPKRKRNDARHNDHRLRLAMLAVVNERDRVNRGIRRLANDAGISEASVRRALVAWETEGQLSRDNRGRGKTQSVKLNLDHPCWSEYKPSHPHDS